MPAGAGSSIVNPFDLAGVKPAISHRPAVPGQVECYCGARWVPPAEPPLGWRRTNKLSALLREFAWREWWRHHGGPLRKCGAIQ